MVLRKIAQIGHPILRKTPRIVDKNEINTPGFQELIEDLIATMYDANGAGIAAPQIYESVSLCAIHVQNNPRYPYKPNIPLTVLINPEISFLSSEMFLNNEGCLSVPNLRGDVERCVHVRVEALDRFGNSLDFEVKGLSAGTFQHEVDHLKGKLFVDHVKDPRSLCTWNEFERFRKEEFVRRVSLLVEKYGS